MSQLTVSCENRPGTLAELTRILGDAKVNILAFNAGSAGAMSYVQLIVNNPSMAKKVLKAKGMSYYEERVLHVTLQCAGSPLSFCREAGSQQHQHWRRLSNHRRGLKEGERSIGRL